MQLRRSARFLAPSLLVVSSLGTGVVTLGACDPDDDSLDGTNALAADGSAPDVTVVSPEDGGGTDSGPVITPGSVAVGGTVTGLASAESVVLLDNGGDALTVSANGGFTFHTGVTTGQPYAVTVKTNPSGAITQTCAVTSGTGTAAATVTSVLVTCTPPGGYSSIGYGPSLAQCAIAPNSTLWCWGYNTDDDLNDGGANVLTPTPLGAALWKSVSPAQTDFCGIQTDGSLWCWGSNGSGQLGDGTAVDHNLPGRVLQGTTWTAVSASSNSVCGIQTDGSLWCWGNNSYGNLGDGTTNPQPVPEHIGIAAWKAVSNNGFTVCGVQTDSTLWCWGNNSSGQVGDGTTTGRLTPTHVAVAGTWASISMGAEHVCGLQADESLWCWGSNFFGQLGNGNIAVTQIPTPTRVGTSSWIAVSAAQSNTASVQSNGTLWTWGSGGSMLLGDNTTTTRSSPVQVGAGTTWSAISLTYEAAYGLLGGDLYGWGPNNYGELANGTSMQPEPTPSRIP